MDSEIDTWKGKVGMLTHFHISQRGESHIKKDMPCQDYSDSRMVYIERFKCNVILAAIADGVGSCEFSQFGSKAAVNSLLEYMEHYLGESIVIFDDDNILSLLKVAFGYALSQVEKIAEEKKLPCTEFDSTLTGILYDGHNLWFGHIGDDGIVALFSDGTYEMITTRHKGEEIHSVFPLRETKMWQFGKAGKDVAACVLMTDGVLDYCVDTEVMKNRVYYPFLEPALTSVTESDEQVQAEYLDWNEYFAGESGDQNRIRDTITDDISFVVVKNSDVVKKMPELNFDFEKWDQDTKKRKKELDEALYTDYRAYKAGNYHNINENKTKANEKTKSIVNPKTKLEFLDNQKAEIVDGSIIELARKNSVNNISQIIAEIKNYVFQKIEQKEDQSDVAFFEKKQEAVDEENVAKKSTGSFEDGDGDEKLC